MSVSDLLSRLSKVKKTGSGNWIACCPAHDDKRPSMTVRETEDGTILVHCFSGCSIDEILSSVQLPIESLFPPRKHHSGPMKMPFHPADILRLLGYESRVVAASAATMRQRPLSKVEQDRLMECAVKINAALTAGGIHG